MSDLAPPRPPLVLEVSADPAELERQREQLREAMEAERCRLALLSRIWSVGVELPRGEA